MAELIEYPEDAPFPGVVGRTLAESSPPAWPAPVRARPGSPNVVLWVLDDVGYGQLSPFGGLCEMPTLERLAARGLCYANAQTTALCSPTRGCLLTGRNHHSLGLSSITETSLGYPAHDGYPRRTHGFLSEILVERGFNTFAVGKWHLTPPVETTAAGPFHRWPLGRGFERAYGFLAGDTDQWFPDLFDGNNPVEPPYTPEEGYHLNRDLADRAIAYIRDAHVCAPDKPFFLYFATGAGHAPHQVEPEWIERYRGRFDAGWDAYRDEVLARQIERGIVAPDTELAPRDPDVPAWDTLSEDARRMAARQMETYAGFLTQTDHHFGRLVDFLEEIGELDDTLILVISDNGASAEGGVDGTFNETLFFNQVPERLEDNLQHYDDWGGLDTFNHYAWGWAWAGNTPFRRWKRETYRGGISDPLIVSWPSGIGAAGEVRHQYVHAVDVAATVLDVLGLEPPDVLRGVPQSRLHGVSFASTFGDAEAPGTRTTQYFEMFGHRSLYHDGWRAVCPFVGPSLAEAASMGRIFGLTELTPEILDELDATGWELYDVRRDPGESRNRAAEEPELLRAMISRWYEEAGRYGAFPLASVTISRLITRRPELTTPRIRYEYLPDAAPVPFIAAPRVLNRAHRITAEIEVPARGAGGAAVEGILLSQGNRHGGFAFYVHDGRLHHVHNFLGLERFTVAAPQAIPVGRHTVAYEFTPTGPANVLFGQGTPGTGTLFVDGDAVASLDLPRTVPITFGIMGLSCGYDTADAVDPTGWRAPFRFTGRLERVVLELLDGQDDDAEGLIRQAMGSQ
ncbi:MAG: arylsulfatase [Acidimicrobiales bacterium]|jgi:arylsulfatase|nr:arylsulfatase [Acidimicrobiales bacterium]